MKTERGSIVAEFQTDEKTVRRMSKKLYIGSILALVVGSVGLAAYLVVGVWYYALTETDLVWGDALLVFAVPFGFGLIFVITLNKQYKQAAATSDCMLRYEFFADYILLREFRRGELTGTAKFLYSQIVSVRQNKEFLYFAFIKPAPYPLWKPLLTEEELNTVKSLLHLPYEGETVELSPLPADRIADEVKDVRQTEENKRAEESGIDGIFTWSDTGSQEGEPQQKTPNKDDLS